MSKKRFSESGYQRKLRDLRWQKRRLQLLDSADWKCQEPACRTWMQNPKSDPPLEIHHLYYEWGKDPWDYPDEAFMVLCEDCHEKRAAAERIAKKEFITRMRIIPSELLLELTKEFLDEKFNGKKESVP